MTSNIIKFQFGNFSCSEVTKYVHDLFLLEDANYHRELKRQKIYKIDPFNVT